MTAAERKELHERKAKTIGGYTAFLAALLVATFARSNDYPHAWLVILLLAVSLPSLVAYVLLDFIILVKQGRKKSVFRGMAVALGFLPSLGAIACLIGHYSVMAAILFSLVTLFWVFAIDVVAFLGASYESDV